jgi:hypothetical protein
MRTSTLLLTGGVIGAAAAWLAARSGAAPTSPA